MMNILPFQNIRHIYPPSSQKREGAIPYQPAKPVLIEDQVCFRGARDSIAPPSFTRRTVLSVPGTQVFNPGVIENPEGGYYFLYRSHEELPDGHQDKPAWGWRSWLRLATLDLRGRLVGESQRPDISVDLKSFPNGLEDSRITKIGDTYYIVANASNRTEVAQGTLYNPGPLNHSQAKMAPVPRAIKGGHELDSLEYNTLLEQQLKLRGATPFLFTTQDFKTFTPIGVIGPKNIYDKNAFFHPEKIQLDGKEYFMLYHRIFPSIQFVLAKSLTELQDEMFWDKHLTVDSLNQDTLLKPLFDWESSSIGGAGPPIKTEKGWLFLYQGSSKDPITKVTRYCVGAALLDLQDPRHVIARSPRPILEPEGSEDEKNIVLPTSYLIHSRNPFEEKQLNIYYGADDVRCRVASCSLPELLAYLEQFNEKGEMVK